MARKPKATPPERPASTPPTFDPAHLATLDRIARGEPDERGRVPGVREQVAALRLLADFALARPRPGTEPTGGTVVLVVDPYSKP